MSDTLPFQAEVQQLLELVVHSLYSDREIFLRELVSNASDALDRARFSALQRNDLRTADGEPAITIAVDKAKGTITVSDNGIGLTREQAIEHLGTIARSGTKAFAQKLKEKGTSAEGLIGQFGVGFYASFMVAHKVEVQSLSGEPDAEPVHWVSDGAGTFTVETGTRATRGTDVVLHVRSDAADFLDDARLREVIERHSDFVQYPIRIGDEQVNQSQALWSRDPREVTADEYKSFYKHVCGDWQDPLAWVHFRSEAPLEFSSALFFPEKRPFDLDHPEVKRGLKLYQRRVLVLENAENFLPRYLRFVKGVVDAPEVQLNVSREILQNTPVISAIKKQLVKRVLRRLKELGREEPQTYRTFWENFGATLKEGIAEDSDNKDALLPLLRFRTTSSTDEEPWRDLAAIKADMKEGQDAIWYLTGLDLERMKLSPQLERFRKKGFEVILLSDPVDEWVVMNLTEYDGTPLKSVARGDLDEKDEDPIAEEARKQAEPFANWLAGLLSGSVQSVRPSKRLTESPAVLVDADWGVSANMERILRAARQEGPKASRVLEINPEHALVKKLVALHRDGKSDAAEPLARLLLDYAKIAEGNVDDAAGFSKRLSALMEQAGQGL
ncbi:MAG: molecular chaperone HtpG [Myxococcota bacterium]